MVNKIFYSIPIVGLRDKAYSYAFELSPSFFNIYTIEGVENPRFTIKVELKKNNHLFELLFYVDGQIETKCDRCCNQISINIMENFHQIIKQVTNHTHLQLMENDPDIIYIGFNDSTIILDNLFYEFINISIPFHKFCQNYGSTCDEKMLKILDNLQPVSTYSISDKLKINKL